MKDKNLVDLPEFYRKIYSKMTKNSFCFAKITLKDKLSDRKSAL